MKNIKAGMLSISLFITILTTSCSSVAGKRNIVLKQDASVTVEGAGTVEKKAGEKVELARTVLIEAPGKMSVLVVPLTDGQSDLDIVLPDLKQNKLSVAFQSEMQAGLDHVLSEVAHVYSLMFKKKTSDALRLITALKEKYPGISTLSFLQASCYLMEGKKSLAKKHLEDGLVLNPDHPEARKMYFRILAPGEQGIIKR